MKKSWRDHEYMWVVGCITSHGAIIASPSKEGRMHTVEEHAGKRWRWCVWSQEFCYAGTGGPQMTFEEERIVEHWLVGKGYASEEAFMWDKNEDD